MKTILILLSCVLLLSLSTSSEPCHPKGDIVNCNHPLHINGDVVNFYGDRVKCIHPRHPAGHLVKCTHICN